MLIQDEYLGQPWQNINPKSHTLDYFSGLHFQEESASYLSSNYALFQKLNFLWWQLHLIKWLSPRLCVSGEHLCWQASCSLLWFIWPWWDSRGFLVLIRTLQPSWMRWVTAFIISICCKINKEVPRFPWVASFYHFPYFHILLSKMLVKLVKL